MEKIRKDCTSLWRRNAPDEESQITDVALTAPKTTDVFWVHPDGGHKHLTLDATLVVEWQVIGVRAAYRSAAYILRAMV